MGGPAGPLYAVTYGPGSGPSREYTLATQPDLFLTIPRRHAASRIA
jgi:hypothetical protein